MKRYILYIFSLLGTALLGVQCTEIFESEAAPAPTGTVEVSLTATRSATKTSLTETAAGLDAVWETGDTMYVVAPSGGSLGFLTAIESGTTAEFTGTISAWSGTQNLQFYYLGKGETITDGATSFNYDVSTQSGTLAYLATKQLMHGSKTSVPAGTTNFGSIVLTNLNSVGKFNLAANLDESATLTCGLAYSTASLDLAAGTLTPSVGTINLGTNIPNASAYYMVLIPGTSHMQFSDGTTTLDMYRSIEADRFYCADPAGTAIVVLNMQIPGALSGGFSVSATKKVQFSQGNLYYDGSAFKFEDNQYSSATSWSTTHVSHFYWSKTPSVAYAASYSDSGASGTDILFTNADATTANPDFTVNGFAGVWRTLSGGSDGEWSYLLSTRTVNGGTGEGKSYRRATIRSDVSGGKYGLIIYPDNYTAQTTATSYSSSEWEAMENDGCVFLPAAGFRNGSSISSTNYYSSSTAYDSSFASFLVFGSGTTIVPGAMEMRIFAGSVRLVKDQVDSTGMRGTLNGQEYVIIKGSDGKYLKWATQNLAVTASGQAKWKSTDYQTGDYFQWAASYAGYGLDGTTGKEQVPENLVIYSSFTHYNSSFGLFSGWKDSKQFNKASAPYGGSSYTKYTGPSGDGKTVLELTDDVANIVLGGTWRIPTGGSADETKAMRAATYWAWDATDKGYYVFKPGVGTSGAANASGNIAGTDDKTKALLFFPATGCGISTTLGDVGDFGLYWLSTLKSDNPDYVYDLYFYSLSVFSEMEHLRYNGFSVRPVSD